MQFKCHYCMKLLVVMSIHGFGKIQVVSRGAKKINRFRLCRGFITFIYSILHEHKILQITSAHLKSAVFSEKLVDIH